MVEWATEWVVINERIEARAAQIMRFGLAAFDALHLACSEAGGVDVFLSTDDRLLNCAQRNRAELRVAAENPLAWFRELKV
jgi:predicted nucleic acid-binding protein